MKCFISFFFFPKPALICLLCPKGLHNQIRRPGKWGADTRNAQKDEEDHLPLSTVTGEAAACGGQDLACVPGIMNFHLWTPDAIYLKKHNFRSTSGPQAYMVEVPPLIQPEHLQGEKYSPGCAM